MQSLRVRMLLGIVAANVTAFSALAIVVVRDIDRRTEAQAEARRNYRDIVVDHVTKMFVSFLGEFDFNELDVDGGESSDFFHRVLSQDHWQYVRDACIAKDPTFFGESAFAAKIQLNPVGVPDEESERQREGALVLMAEVFASGQRKQRGDDVVVIPLYSGGDRSELRRLRSAARESVQSAQETLRLRNRPLTIAESERMRIAASRLDDELRSGVSAPTPWGAAYIRVAVPPLPEADSSLDLTAIALAIGGATLLAIAALWLLLRRLFLEPLAQVSTAAVSVASGALETRLRPTGDSAEIDGLIANFNRMTAELAESRGALQRRVDEALTKLRDSEKRLVLNERLAAMGTLAAGIAHEINNPLGGMLNAVQTLKRRADKDETSRRYLGLVEDGLGRVRDVVEVVLRFSPARARRGEQAIATIVDDAARFVRHRLRDKDARLEIDVGSDLMVNGDSAALGQVILNLLLNAIDSLEERSGRIAVSARLESGSVVLAIADTGCGMTAEQREHAFDLFFTTKASGTGLGLSIAHQIVAEHGGSIAIDSVIGRGTTIEVRLPRVAATPGR